MTATNQPDRSPVPGIIPEPVDLSHGAAPVTPATGKPVEPKPGRGNPASIAFARVMGALRGDKYMVDAYPTAGHEGAATGAATSDETGAQAP
jgi:hypothetical protein